MNDYFALFLSIVTILGLGWKANDELKKIKNELKQNTQTTVEAKNSTVDTSAELKKALDKQFVKLQEFNASRYREIAVAQSEQRMQIMLLNEKLKTLEAKLDAITRSSESQKSSD